MWKPAWILALALATACGRTPEPESTRPAETAGQASRAPDRPAEQPAEQTTPPAPTQDAAGRCVVPTSADPPPTAHKAGHCPKDPGGPGELPHGYVTFVDAPGKPRAGVELANDDATRERGLMYRTHMPDDQGMLFSWNKQEVRTFWMRNTCIPLDMLFIAQDGTIAGVLEQVPTLNDDSRTVPCPVSHVLELNAGYARSHSIKAGQKVKLEP